MDIYEEAVMRYVTVNGRRFVCPQYSIKKPDNPISHSDIDFLAIDFHKSTIYIVETTSAGESIELANKILSHAIDWQKYLREAPNLKTNAELVAMWDIRITAFMWERCIEKFERKIKTDSNVATMVNPPIPLENVLDVIEWPKSPDGFIYTDMDKGFRLNMPISLDGHQSHVNR